MREGGLGVGCRGLALFLGDEEGWKIDLSRFLVVPFSGALILLI
jgi:hypothetical protein